MVRIKSQMTVWDYIRKPDEFPRECSLILQFSIIMLSGVLSFRTDSGLAWGKTDSKVYV